MPKEEKIVTPEEAYQLAKQCIAKKKYQMAKDLCEKLLAAAPSIPNLYQSADLYNLLGQIDFALNKHHEAIKKFEKALTENPIPNATYLKVLHILGQSKKAINILESAVKIDSNNTGLLRDLAFAYTSTYQFKKSINVSLKIIELTPLSNDYANLCYCYAGLAKLEESKKYGLMALEKKDEETSIGYSKIKAAIIELNDKQVFNQLNPEKVIKPKEGNKLITFSLWGNDPTYLEGAIENAQLAHTIYPDWVCRFYCAPDVPNEIIERLVKEEAQIIQLPEPQNPYDKYLWRFYVTDDPEVERFISRDCDCRLNTKEKTAVDEWCRSKKSFHIMRDSILHCELILAGMCGGINKELPNLYLLYQSIPHIHSKWTDQRFLAKYIWPFIKEKTLIHDSYYQFYGKAFPDSEDMEQQDIVGAGFRFTEEK